MDRNPVSHLLRSLAEREHGILRVGHRITANLSIEGDAREYKVVHIDDMEVLLEEVAAYWGC